MRKKLLITTICFFLLAASMAIAYERLNTMYFDTGTATLEFSPFGIEHDTFTVLFDNPVPIDYQITLNGQTSFITEVWDSDMSGMYGYGELVKDCYTTEQTQRGFRGICHYKLYMISMRYGKIGEYSNFAQLERDFKLIGVDDTYNKVEWQLMAKEGNGLMRLSI